MRLFPFAAIAALSLASCAGTPYAVDAGKVVATVSEAGVSISIETVIRRLDRDGYSPEEARAELARLDRLAVTIGAGRATHDLVLLVPDELRSLRAQTDSLIEAARRRLLDVARG